MNMNFVQSLFRYVLVACIVMALYCFVQVAQDDATWHDLKTYGFFQMLFSVGAMASYVIVNPHKFE